MGCFFAYLNSFRKCFVQSFLLIQTIKARKYKKLYHFGKLFFPFHNGSHVQKVKFSDLVKTVLKFKYFNYRLIGPINPKKPADAFALQVWLLKRLGLWPPETESNLVKVLYTIWSYFYRWFFLYTYTATQVLFFLNVEDLGVSRCLNDKEEEKAFN